MNNDQNEIEDNKFTWNDSVKISEYAPPQMHPGEIAVICGMEKVSSALLIEIYQSSIGDWVYTVEFVDGSSIEVPERYLKAYPGSLKYLWGDTVKIKKNAPSSFFPGMTGSVCGFHKIVDETLAKSLNHEIDDWIYIVKFENENSILVPEEYIETN